jgi:hypothetical protein
MPVISETGNAKVKPKLKYASSIFTGASTWGPMGEEKEASPDFPVQLFPGNRENTPLFPPCDSSETGYVKNPHTV